MLRLLLLKCCLLISLFTMAKTIPVKNIGELDKANKEAKPGDIIELQNGEWNQVNIVLDCNGTKNQPITFKAQTAGKVRITGHSKLQLGGSFIIVDGLYFVNGYAGDDPVIKFCIDKNTIANNCRVTNTVINDFNNAKRMDENYWVSFYGKNNRLDHCSFMNKKNMGVLLAVILEDERSRENFHSIDHNYFGVRLPLASNTGEMIRVGVSQHCEFNSNTQITGNFFENCDGEAEIVSIKSGSNVIRDNLFKACQGAVVLRHGNFNIVENNLFLGNNKAGTGGVRIINKGQWVVNNYFYQCRGEEFRAPLSIMNGVPNSPAFRYVAVTDAVIANNSFVECSTLSFCLGSDAERSETPGNVQFLNNIYSNSKDSLVYFQHDDMSGIQFTGNLVSKTTPQKLTNGFTKTYLSIKNTDKLPIPNSESNLKNRISDSIQAAGQSRLTTTLSATPGYSAGKSLSQIQTNAASECGAKWFIQKNTFTNKAIVAVNCKTAEEVIQQIEKNKDKKLTINLTGKEYTFNAPVNISTDVIFSTIQRTGISFSTTFAGGDFLMHIQAGKSLRLKNLLLDLTAVNTSTVITTDTSGSSYHSNFSMANCSVSNLNGSFFNAAKSSVTDSIVISNCSFNKGRGILLSFMAEVDKKGYYNVEQLKITNSNFNNLEGPLLGMLRSGNDESTMGPILIFSNNNIMNCFTKEPAAVIHIYGTQRSFIEKNSFINCNAGKTLIHFEDMVSAVHRFNNNVITQSGAVITNKYVLSEHNAIQ